jgi:hypothetical protein
MRLANHTHFRRSDQTISQAIFQEPQLASAQLERRQIAISAD